MRKKSKGIGDHYRHSNCHPDDLPRSFRLPAFAGLPVTVTT